MIGDALAATAYRKDAAANANRTGTRDPTISASWCLGSAIGTCDFSPQLFGGHSGYLTMERHLAFETMPFLCGSSNSLRICKRGGLLASAIPARRRCNEKRRT